MEGHDKKDLLANPPVYSGDGGPPPAYDVAGGVTNPQFYPPPAPGLPPSVGSQPYPQQQVPVTIQQPAMHGAGPQVVHDVNTSCDGELFAREAAYAQCVRLCWCRPIGWLAVEQLDKARCLYLAGEYEQAMEAARCANIWSTVGLVSGLILVAITAAGVYFIISYGIK